MNLAKEQIQTVQSYLSKNRLSSGIEEELLDHLCCQIETEIEAGLSFDIALRNTTNTWHNRRLRRLNNSILISKYRPMLVRISAAAALLISLFLLNPFQDTAEVAVVAPSVIDSKKKETSATNYSFPVMAQDIVQQPTASPLRGVALTDYHSGFGMRKHPISKEMVMHRGIDLKASLGTAVYATAGGRVIFAGENGANGIQVRIAHMGGYVTVYNHLQEHNLEPQQVILQGVQIGKVGTTGASTGPHLHYEIWKNDEAVNPC